MLVSGNFVKISENVSCGALGSVLLKPHVGSKWFTYTETLLLLSVHELWTAHAFQPRTSYKVLTCTGVFYITDHLQLL